MENIDNYIGKLHPSKREAEAKASSNSGIKVGYGRVSTTGQKLDVQIDSLVGYGVGGENLYLDKCSGTNPDRTELKECLNFLRKGDELVITRMDRLARSTRQLTNIAKELEDKGVELVVLEQDIDTKTPTGRLMFGLLAIIAEFETELRAERQAEGIAKAKENGVQFGAKAKLTEEQIIEMKALRESGVIVKDLASHYGIDRSSVYRLIKEAA